MLTRIELCAQLHISGETLEAWIADGWLLPLVAEGAPGFSEIDVARGRFIIELRRELGVNDEGVGVILDLVDQIHGLRLRLRDLVEALRVQPPTVGRRIVGEAVRLSRLESARSSQGTDRM